MARLAGLRLRLPVLILAAGLVYLLSRVTVLPAAQSAGQGAAFTERTTSQLLEQITAGLVAHNPRKTLGAFDLARMDGGALFQQQIAAFLAQTGIIRVHFNVVQAVMEDGKGVATVDVEMEADLRDDRLPPVHKQAQLRLVAENSAAGWRFTDVQPRSFFSTQP